MVSYKVRYGKQDINLNLFADERTVCIQSALATKPLDIDSMHAKIIESFKRSDIKDVICSSTNIIIVIDDATRPTPSNILLPMVIGELERHAPAKPSIIVIVALGMHRQLDEAALRVLVGSEVFDHYPVLNHLARSDEDLVDLGISSFGTPIQVNRIVAQADLRILLGMIKPHNQAGYTGGGKSILPGVCGIKTIEANHSYRYMSHQNSRIGILEGNPIRNDIDEAFLKMGPSILVNLIMDRTNAIADIVVDSDVIRGHRKGACFYDQLGKFKIDQFFDVALCGTPDPIDCNFYQMLNALSAPCRLPQSIIKERGTIVVFGRALAGISDGDMRACKYFCVNGSIHSGTRSP